MMKSRLKAFTLLEVLFGMIISAIVISAAYLGYEMMQKRFVLFRENGKTIQEAVRLKTVITRDFLNAGIVSKTKDGLFCGTFEPVNYRFEKNCVIRRTNQSTDTFNLITSGPVSFFYGKEKGNEPGAIDAMTFEADILGEKELFRFEKEYGAEFLMNNKELNKQVLH